MKSKANESGIRSVLTGKTGLPALLADRYPFMAEMEKAGEFRCVKVAPRSTGPMQAPQSGPETQN